MENAVYWNGRQVGIECAGRISWFSSAQQEGIAAYGSHPERPERAPVKQTGEAAVTARNLGVAASFDRVRFGA